MGYFSNGAEGEDYCVRWCDRCIHQEGCPIWAMHLFRNYEECNNPDSPLHVLIPRTKDGLGNEKCKMFIDEGYFSELQRQHFRGQSETSAPG